MIKGIIFDLGGVLVPDETENIIKEFSKQTKIDYETLKTQLEANNESLVTGKLSMKEFLTKIRNRFELEEDSFTLQMTWDRIYVESTPINFELLDEIKALRSTYSIALLTNIYDSTARINQSRKLFYAFKPVILSCRVGVAKPDIKIFARAIRDMQLKGEECVFIDDKEANVEAAKEFGMKTILFKDNKQLMKELKKLKVKPKK